VPAAIAATGCEVLRPRVAVDDERARADTASVRGAHVGLHNGVSMVRAGSVALKDCAARTGKPALALDRDAAAKRVAMMPLWRNGCAGGFSLTRRPLM
jgi:hypothetical protein